MTREILRPLRLTVAAIAALVLTLSGAQAQAALVGGCSDPDEVSIVDLQLCSNIFLGSNPLDDCLNCARPPCEEVGITDLQGAVNCFLDSSTMPDCPTTTCGDTSPPRCGDGVVQPPEQCDNGGACFSGSRLGLLCTSDEECPEGVDNPCRAFGGDGCASNCTTETLSTFVFTGAQCYGGAKNGQLCKFEAACVGGSKPGRPCASVSDCPGGACVSECGADSRGCFGVGECDNNIQIACPVTATGGTQTTCSSGANAGLPCSTAGDCGGAACVNPCNTGMCLNKSRAALISLSVPILIGPLIGQQTSAYGKPDPVTGIVPIANPQTGTSFNPVQVPGTACACVRGAVDPGAHGPGNSGSGLINCGAGTIANDVTLGVDHSTLPPRICAGGTNNGMPCSPRCNAGGANAGQPCRVIGPNSPDCPGTGGQRLCNQSIDCPGGGVCTVSNGPGRCNAASTNAGRACFDNTQCTGASGRCEGRCTTGNVGTACTCEGGAGVNSCTGGACGTGGICNVVGSLGGGACMGPPKFCVGGTSPGKACFNASECGGGTCSGAGGSTAGSFLKWCSSNTDCPGSLCNSPDDPQCDDFDPAPPAGSGDVACRETKEVCTAGTNIGQPCTSNAQCPGANDACGTTCNAQSRHPNTCNSPTHITISGVGGQGSALILSTTAIGTITGETVPDLTCSYAAKCAGGSNSGAFCQIDLDCPGGQCAGAICNGFCSNDSTRPCLSNANCSGGVCLEGSAFNTKCTAQGACGTGGVCVPVETAKGLDGRPCTADDAVGARGVPQTIPQTTGRSFTGIIDSNATAGAQLVHIACVGGTITPPTACTSTVVGTAFDCSQLEQPAPSVSGTRLANTFPTIDGVTGDGVVSTFLTAR